MKITVIGTGYVGLVTGSCFAHMGNTVQCVDINQKKIDGLQQGQLPIYEPGLQEIVEVNARGNRLFFTTDLAAAVHTSEFIFIAVGTPMSEDGSADLQHVLKVADSIGQVMDAHKIVITKSTVPVGTAARVRSAIEAALIKRGIDTSFDVVSNPEFLKEGRAVDDFLKPDRIVVGTESDHARKRLQAMYDPFCRTDENRIIFMDLPSAELTKYAANAMLATRISFMNEIAAICEATGADVDQVRVGIGSDNRIGRRFLFPGVGYGGSCFPKDVRALMRTADELDLDLHLIPAIDVVNNAQKSVMAAKIMKQYGPDLTGKSFAIWGLAFKPETDDVRESPAAVIIRELVDAGAAIKAYDPIAIDTFKEMYNLPIEYSSGMYECLEDTDALVLVTEWHHFRRPDFTIMSERIGDKMIFDGRNQYELNYVKDRGFTYHSVGRGSVHP